MLIFAQLLENDGHRTPSSMFYTTCRQHVFVSGIFIRDEEKTDLDCEDLVNLEIKKNQTSLVIDLL